MNFRNKTLITLALAGASFSTFAGEITDFSDWPAVTYTQAANAGDIRWIDNETGFVAVPAPSTKSTLDTRAYDDKSLTFA